MGIGPVNTAAARGRRVFDAHLHIIDPRFPLAPNDGYVPEPFTAKDYLMEAVPLGVVGGAVVSGSFQAFDQGYLREALRMLGPSFVGVTQLPPTVRNEEVLALDAVGVRAIRFNLRRSGLAGLRALPEFAARVYDLAGWHAEVYLDGSDLSHLEAVLSALPCVVVDHLGLRKAGLPTLLQLVEQGVYVKATGFGRLDFDPAPVLRDVASANPRALLFGTDLPSTRAPHSFRDQDLRIMMDVLTRRQAAKALFENAMALYRPTGLIADEDASGHTTA